MYFFFKNQYLFWLFCIKNPIGRGKYLLRGLPNTSIQFKICITSFKQLSTFLITSNVEHGSTHSWFLTPNVQAMSVTSASKLPWGRCSGLYLHFFVATPLLYDARKQQTSKHIFPPTGTYFTLISLTLLLFLHIFTLTILIIIPNSPSFIHT